MDESDFEISRRQFLRRALEAGVTAGATGLVGAACDGRAPTGDSGGRDSALLDTDRFDATDLHGAEAGNDAADATDTLDAADIREIYGEISKPPFVQNGEMGGARLRFETSTSTPLEVRLQRRGGSSVEKMAQTSTREVDYMWPPTEDFPVQPDHPDEPGTYTVQEAQFDNLEPGEEYTWVIHVGEGKQVEGTFTASPPRGAEFSFAFVGDTMQPKAFEIGKLMHGRRPDVFLHGGDIQYQTNPRMDTYNGLFEAFADLFSIAPAHFCVGNHEHEDHNEFELFYRRLFAADRGSKPVNFHGFDYGGIRFLVLDSEGDFSQGSMQYNWLDQQLRSAEMNPSVRFSVVAFHRPYFTFSNSFPDFATRDVFHPLFKKHSVPLVLTGHNHCYEHFEADGVHYVVEGGGGAILYWPNDNRDEVLAKRPGDEKLRKSFEKTHGALFATVQSDGTIDIERESLSGETTDSFTVGA